MQCFELREKLRRGIVTLYPYVFLGHPGSRRSVVDLVRHLQEDHGDDEPVECTTCAAFRWDGWNRLPDHTDEPSMILTLHEEMRDWMRAELIDIDRGQPFRLTHADLLADGHGVFNIIGRADMKNDNRALLLVSNGGRAMCRNHLARLVIDAGDQIVTLEPGGVVRVVRAGPLEGGRSEFIFGWDGKWMHAFHETTHPSEQRVAAATQRVQESPPVHRLIEHAPPTPKVTLTADDVVSLGLPPGAQRITVLGVECVIWNKGTEYVGADWLSKKRRKSGIRVGGASSMDEAVAMLEAEIKLTSPAT